MMQAQPMPHTPSPLPYVTLLCMAFAYTSILHRQTYLVIITLHGFILPCIIKPVPRMYIVVLSYMALSFHLILPCSDKLVGPYIVMLPCMTVSFHNIPFPMTI